MNNFEKMQAGHPYLPLDDDLYKKYLECHRKIRIFNNLEVDGFAEQDRILRQILGKCGASVRIEAPFHCDYGFNIEVGNNFFANYNLVILDVGKVRIGDNVLFGPNVAIYAVTHPLHPGRRATGYETGIPVMIGDNVWLGGNVVINPGITVGNNVVVGSGSIVTRDLPDNALVAGNPARVLRFIDEEERHYYHKKMKFSDLGIFFNDEGQAHS